jgi:hypothetical protein
VSRADQAEGWNAFIQQEMMRFLHQFQAVEIAVFKKGDGRAITVPVHAPYMMQSVTLIDSGEGWDQLARRHQLRLLRVRRARDSAPAEVQAFLRYQFYGDGSTEAGVAQGRAEPQEIQRLLQGAVDGGLIPAGAGRSYPNGRDLRDWLKEYGIGVDCSAFVQQALTRVMTACQAAVGECGAQLRAEPAVGWLSSRGVYSEVTAGPDAGRRFDRVYTPSKARPGDVVVRNGHVRIVAEAAPAEGGALRFHLAESTSASDIPCGQASEEADIGPRLIEVLYPVPERPIREQSPLCRRLVHDQYKAQEEEREYVLGRLRALGDLCSKHMPHKERTRSRRDSATRPGTD